MRLAIVLAEPLQRTQIFFLQISLRPAIVSLMIARLTGQYKYQINNILDVHGVSYEWRSVIGSQQATRHDQLTLFIHTYVRRQMALVQLAGATTVWDVTDVSGISPRHRFVIMEQEPEKLITAVKSGCHF